MTKYCFVFHYFDEIPPPLATEITWLILSHKMEFLVYQFLTTQLIFHFDHIVISQANYNCAREIKTFARLTFNVGHVSIQ